MSRLKDPKVIAALASVVLGALAAFYGPGLMDDVCDCPAAECAAD